MDHLCEIYISLGCIFSFFMYVYVAPRYPVILNECWALWMKCYRGFEWCYFLQRIFHFLLIDSGQTLLIQSRIKMVQAWVSIFVKGGLFSVFALLLGHSLSRLSSEMLVCLWEASLEVLLNSISVLPAKVCCKAVLNSHFIS